MTSLSFPTLEFGKNKIPLKHWDSFWATKYKSYNIKLLSHVRIDEKNYQTILTLKCRERAIWHRCIEALLEAKIRPSVFFVRKVKQTEGSLEFEFPCGDDLDLFMRYAAPRFPKSKFAPNEQSQSVKITGETEMIQELTKRFDHTGLDAAGPFKHHVEPPEHTRSYDADEENITEIIKSITIPTQLEEIERWIADPLSLLGAEDKKCKLYLRREILLAIQKKDNQTLAKLMSLASTISGFDFLGLFSRDTQPIPDSKSSTTS